MKKNYLILILSFAFTYSIRAQSLTPDPNWGIKGVVKTDAGNLFLYDCNNKSLIVTPEDILYQINEENSSTFITKRFANGSIDSSFGTNGISDALPIISSHAALQADGNIIIAGKVERTVYGDFGGVLSEGDFAISRIESTGKLDQTFGTSGITTIDFYSDDQLNSVMIQSDQKILITGASNGVEDFQGLSSFELKRLNQDGTIDNTFSFTAPPFDSNIFSEQTAALDKNGKIIVEGNNIDSLYIVRFNADGTLDPSFNGSGILSLPYADGTINSMAVQNDNKIVIGLSGSDFIAKRLNADGTIDLSFGTSGKQTIAFGNTSNQNVLTLQNNGKIVLGGIAVNNGHNNFAIVRLNTDGSPDHSFNGDGKLTTDLGPSYESINSLSFKSNGDIVASGIVDNVPTLNRPTIASYNTDGSNDLTLNNKGWLIDSIHRGYTNYNCGTVQSDGKYVAGGTVWNGTNFDFLIARYNIDGILDPTFSQGGITTIDFASGSDKVAAITIQPDGKIVVAGSSGNNEVIARLTANGNIDATFNGIGYNTTNLNDSAFVTAITLQPDGKILVGGKTSMLRYDADGTIDNSFGSGGQVAGNCQSIIVQNNSRIIVATGSGESLIVTGYKPDGSVDNSFANNGTNNIFIYDNGSENVVTHNIAIDLTGRIVINGDFTSLIARGTVVGYPWVARLDSNGNGDSNFGNSSSYSTPPGVEIISSVSSVTNRPTCLKVQPNKKILVGEYSYDGANNNVIIVQLNDDGTPDSQFGNAGVFSETAVSASTYNNINTLLFNNDKIYAAGYGSYPDKLGTVLRYLFSSGGALPITLINFEATLRNQSVAVNWQTSAEPNVKDFVVEHSSDGQFYYAPIATTNAKGTANNGSSYVVFDNNPNAGINYYRLKIEDIDKNISYSKIATVDLEGLITVKLLPNPASDILLIQSYGIEGKTILKVTNMIGQSVVDKTITLSDSSNLPVDISKLAKGVYNLFIQNDKTNIIRQFVKE